MKKMATIILGFIIFCVLVTITSCATIEKQNHYELLSGEVCDPSDWLVKVKKRGVMGLNYYTKYDEKGQAINCSGW